MYEKEINVSYITCVQSNLNLGCHLSVECIVLNGGRTEKIDSFLIIWISNFKIF